jgi:hypothetical protein
VPGHRTRILALGLLVATGGAFSAASVGQAAYAGSDRTVTGVLAETHGDDIARGAARTGWALRTATQGTIDLDGIDAARANALRGRAVKVTGRDRPNGHFATQQSSLAALDGASAGAVTAAVLSPGVKNIAIFMVNFTDDTRQPFTADQVRNVVLNGTGSVNAYYQDVSDGQASLTGSVFGYITVQKPSSVCDPGAWGNLARNAAVSSGINLAGFSYFGYVWPYQGSCGWSGMAELPGTNTWINGYNDVATWGHELGHNFGEHHAGTLRCTGSSGAAVMWSSTCTQNDYGDPFSIMGYGSRLHHNVARAHFGFISPYTVPATGGTYTLVPADNATSTAGPRMLRIARTDGTYLALELRQPTGVFDNFLSTDRVVNGVSLRIDSGSGAITKLLDATPSTTSFDDSSLAAGGSFADPLSGLTVTVQSVSPSGAVVNVSPTGSGGGGTPPPPPPPPADTTAPSAVTNLYVYASHRVVRASWSPATDNVGVVGYLVQRTGAGDRVFTTSSFSERLVRGTYTYTVSAMDAAGNVGPATSQVVTVR